MDKNIQRARFVLSFISLCFGIWFGLKAPAWAVIGVAAWFFGTWSDNLKNE